MKFLKIDREFIFSGQIDDLLNILKNSNDISYEILSKREIKFKSEISWGTMTTNGGVDLFEGIKVKAFIVESNSHRLKINLQTKVRSEHYFLIILFAIILVFLAFSSEPKWLYFYVLGLWLISHSWFQFIFRSQEKYLINKVVKKLKLDEVRHTAMS